MDKDERAIQEHVARTRREASHSGSTAPVVSKDLDDMLKDTPIKTK